MERIKKGRTLVAILLSGAIGMGIIGCQRMEDYSSKMKHYAPVHEETFARFGYMSDVNADVPGRYNLEVSQIEVADLDGDGDIDIIVGTTGGDILLYKNNIQQESK